MRRREEAMKRDWWSIAGIVFGAVLCAGFFLYVTSHRGCIEETTRHTRSIEP